MSLSKRRLGLLGRKVGMMRVFTVDGDTVPVTVLDVSNNRVTQIKTEESDGYSAIQVTYGARKASRVTKPEAGHLAKAGVEAGEIIAEFRVDAAVAAEYKAGAHVPATLFAAGELVGMKNAAGKGLNGRSRQDAGQFAQVGATLNTAQALFDTGAKTLDQIEADELGVIGFDAAAMAGIRMSDRMRLDGKYVEGDVDRDPQVHFVHGFAGRTNARQQLKVVILDVGQHRFKVP